MPRNPTGSFLVLYWCYNSRQVLLFKCYLKLDLILYALLLFHYKFSDFVSFYLEKLQVEEQIKSKVSEEKECMLDEGSVELKTGN